MTSKSRLGQGLGALFPDQPITRPTPSRVAARGLTKDGATESDDVTTTSVGVRLSSEKVGEGPTTHDGKRDVSRETSMKTVSRRHRVPSLNALVHPSDMFFSQGGGDSSQGSDQKTSDSAGFEQNRRSTPSPSSTVSKPETSSESDSVDGPVHRTGQGPITPEEDDNGLRPVAGAYLKELALSQIVPNPHQPRAVFDEDELMELADSIKQVGVLQPIVVRSLVTDDPSSQASEDDSARFELIMGERRLRAANLAGLTTIPAIVRTTSDDQMLRDALLENLHRVELNPVEQAAAFQQMMEEFGLTQAKLSQAISLSRPQIANTLRLLKLPGTIQKQVAAGVISAGHARALLSLASTAEMEALAKRIVAEGLSVRSTEEIVMMKASGKTSASRPARSSIWENSAVRQRLEDRFDTKISITGSASRGKIHIVFSSKEDMDRIISLLDPESHASDSTEEWS